MIRGSTDGGTDGGGAERLMLVAATNELIYPKLLTGVGKNVKEES